MDFKTVSFVMVMFKEIILGDGDTFLCGCRWAEENIST
jgi:hypothetical protein